MGARPAYARHVPPPAPARTRPATVQLHRAGCDKHRYARPSKGSTRPRQRSSTARGLEQEVLHGKRSSRPERRPHGQRSSRPKRGPHGGEEGWSEEARVSGLRGAPLHVSCLCHPGDGIESVQLLPRTILSRVVSTRGSWREHNALYIAHHVLVID